MRVLQTLSCGLLGAAVVSAHYEFGYVSRNHGEISPMWKYTREVEKGYGYTRCETCESAKNPYYDLYDENVRCGRAAADRGAGVTTLNVDAGDELSFYGSFEGRIQPISHTGPGMAYLSKAPGSLEIYRGDGDWFKIGELSAKSDTKWIISSQNGPMNFTIPKTTPPGKYLMRVEHLYPRADYNSSQFFISCTHLDIKGPGGGTPGPMVKFPGAYDNWDPAIWLPYVYYANKNLTKYTPPGPPVWQG